MPILPAFTPRRYSRRALLYPPERRRASNPKANIQHEQISPSVAILDPDDGMGHCALIKATDHAISLARDGAGLRQRQKYVPLRRASVVFLAEQATL